MAQVDKLLLSLPVGSAQWHFFFWSTEIAEAVKFLADGLDFAQVGLELHVIILAGAAAALDNMGWTCF